jgi:SAM-dependent methyltransferase
MTPLTLFCDVDSTLNDHWRRLQRWTTPQGTDWPSARQRAEVMQDQPLPGAVAALQAFAAQGWDIHILTARGWDVPDGGVTRAWLREHGIPYAACHVLPEHQDKARLLRGWLAAGGVVDLVIDDFSHGQELGGPPFTVEPAWVRDCPAPHWVFTPGRAGEWDRVAARWLGRLPNGETFGAFARRNLDWWRGSREFERTSRARYYDNFLRWAGPLCWMGSAVGEIGAGPFGGLLRHWGNVGGTQHFIDVLANGQRALGFIEWPATAVFVDSPMEAIDLPDKALDLVVSYNALDHGSDLGAALREIARVARECVIAFDCKAHSGPEHDRLDHYQYVEYGAVVAMIRQHPGLEILRLGDLVADSPGFHFEHNWGFPVCALHARFH